MTEKINIFKEKIIKKFEIKPSLDITKEKILVGENKCKEKINNPPHYEAKGIKVIDVIEAFDLNFHLGNVLKYILRAGRKTEEIQEDIKKAKWYLDRYLQLITPDENAVEFGKVEKSIWDALEKEGKKK